MEKKGKKEERKKKRGRRKKRERERGEKKKKKRGEKRKRDKKKREKKRRGKRGGREKKKKYAKGNTIFIINKNAGVRYLTKLPVLRDAKTGPDTDCPGDYLSLCS